MLKCTRSLDKKKFNKVYLFRKAKHTIIFLLRYQPNKTIPFRFYVLLGFRSVDYHHHRKAHNRYQPQTCVSIKDFTNIQKKFTRPRIPQHIRACLTPKNLSMILKMNKENKIKIKNKHLGYITEWATSACLELAVAAAASRCCSPCRHSRGYTRIWAKGIKACVSTEY